MLKNPAHARAIRRGIEYAYREREGNDRARSLARNQTDRYRGYLGRIAGTLFDMAFLRTLGKKH